MGTQHTPGPWTIANDNGTDIGIIARKQGRGGQMVAMVTVDEVVPQDDDERLSNARLIASAPDLLAACKAVDDAWTGGENGDWRGALDLALRMARAAIAKAEGKGNENPGATA